MNEINDATISIIADESVLLDRSFPPASSCFANVVFAVSPDTLWNWIVRSI